MAGLIIAGFPIIVKTIATTIAKLNRLTIAICIVGAGSSYGRAPTKETAIANCKRAVEHDWSTLFDLDGKEASINVFDVNGHNTLYWDSRGVFDSETNEAIERLELVQVTLTVKKRRRR